MSRACPVSIQAPRLAGHCASHVLRIERVGSAWSSPGRCGLPAIFGCRPFEWQRRLSKRESVEMSGEDLLELLDRFRILGLDHDEQRIRACLHGRDGGREANLSSGLRELDL